MRIIKFVLLALFISSGASAQIALTSPLPEGVSEAVACPLPINGVVEGYRPRLASGGFGFCIPTACGAGFEATPINKKCVAEIKPSWFSKNQVVESANQTLSVYAKLSAKKAMSAPILLCGDAQEGIDFELGAAQAVFSGDGQLSAPINIQIKKPSEAKLQRQVVLGIGGSNCSDASKLTVTLAAGSATKPTLSISVPASIEAGQSITVGVTASRPLSLNFASALSVELSIDGVVSTAKITIPKGATQGTLSVPTLAANAGKSLQLQVRASSAAAASEQASVSLLGGAVAVPRTVLVKEPRVGSLAIFVIGTDGRGDRTRNRSISPGSGDYSVTIAPGEGFSLNHSVNDFSHYRITSPGGSSQDYATSPTVQYADLGEGQTTVEMFSIPFDPLTLLVKMPADAPVEASLSIMFSIGNYDPIPLSAGQEQEITITETLSNRFRILHPEVNSIVVKDADGNVLATAEYNGTEAYLEVNPASIRAMSGTPATVEVIFNAPPVPTETQLRIISPQYGQIAPVLRLSPVQHTNLPIMYPGNADLDVTLDVDQSLFITAQETILTDYTVTNPDGSSYQIPGVPGESLEIAYASLQPGLTTVQVNAVDSRRVDFRFMGYSSDVVSITAGDFTDEWGHWTMSRFAVGTVITLQHNEYNDNKVWYQNGGEASYGDTYTFTVGQEDLEIVLELINH